MGQGHSTTKNPHQQSSKYAPRESPVDSGATNLSSTKQKKRGGTRSSSTKSSGGGASTGLPYGGGSSKKSAGSSREGSRTLPPAIGDRRLPAVPAQQHSPTGSGSPRSHDHQHYHPASRTSSLTHNQPVSTRHRSTDRKSNAPPSLPSRQFSLSKQTSTGSASGGTSKHTQIEKYFNLYKDKEEAAILAEGIERFCIDLNVDPTEFIVLVLAWKFEASQMCRFTREEFINGCKKMEAFDAKSLRNRFPQLLQDARTEFKDLYQFTFSFGLDHSAGQRSLPTNMAVQLWDLVFTQDRPQVLEHWVKFLGENDTRGISRDTWNMFLDFCQNVAPDLSNYDESEAWPTLFDDFVECELGSRGTL